MFKFNGNANVYVTALSKTELQNEIYEEGDVIAIFRNVEVSLQNASDMKEINTERNNRQLSYSKTNPSVFLINNVEHTNEYNKLVYSVKETGEHKIIKEFSFIDSGKEIYLPLAKGLVHKVKGYVEGKEVEVELKDNNIVELKKSYPEITILVTYSDSCRELSTDSIDLGYVGIQASVQGVFNGEDSTLILQIEKAQLVNDSSVIMTGVYKYPMQFNIIGAKSVKALYEN